MGTLKNYFELGKYKETLLLVFGGAAGGALYPNPFNYIYFYSMIFLFLVVMGTNSITNYIDRDIDAIMERTKIRPLPSGRISPPIKAVYFGSVLIIVGVLGFLYFSLYYAILWIFIGIIFDPLLYNYFTKRKTPWNIVIGSFAGGAPVMVIYSSLSGKFVDPLPLLLMLTIVVWTPIHIWSLAIRYRGDYEKAKVPMLPVVKGSEFTIRIIALSSIILIFISSALSYLVSFYAFIIILFLDIFMVYMVIRLMLNPEEKNSYIVFKISSPYLAMLFLVIVLHPIFSFP